MIDRDEVDPMALNGGNGRRAVVCVTPNLSIDRTLVVEEFRMPAVLRTGQTLAVAGGKGMNVARSLSVLGHRPIAVGMIGGRTGDLLVSLAREEGLEFKWTRIAAETRTCVVVVSASTGNATVVNEEGPEVSDTEWGEFAAGALSAAAHASAVCVSGSLPRGVPSARYGALIAELTKAGVLVYVDSHGEALEAAVDARPHAIKVNADEAGGLLGRSIDSLREAADAAMLIHERGIAEVVITLGNAGAALASRFGVKMVQPPIVEIVSAVGSGDAFLAGYVAAELEGLDPAIALGRGVAAGAANAQSPWGGVFDRGAYLAVLSDLAVMEEAPL